MRNSFSRVNQGMEKQLIESANNPYRGAREKKNRREKIDDERTLAWSPSEGQVNKPRHPHKQPPKLFGKRQIY